MNETIVRWLSDNRDWLFSGAGVTVLLALGGLARWGYRRWSETRIAEPMDARFPTAYEPANSPPLPSRLPGFILRLLYKPAEVRGRIKIALRENAPGSINLSSNQIPSIDLYFQVTNLSAVDLVLDRMLIDVWFGQPTFSTALLHRYVIPAGEVTQGLHVRQMLSDNQKAQITAFQAAAGTSGTFAIYMTAYFESKLGRLFVQQTVERAKL